MERQVSFLEAHEWTPDQHPVAADLQLNEFSRSHRRGILRKTGWGERYACSYVHVYGDSSTQPPESLLLWVGQIDCLR